jgi:hypothetical protein
MKAHRVLVFHESGRLVGEYVHKAKTEQEAILNAMTKTESLAGSANFAFAIKLKKGKK